MAAVSAARVESWDALDANVQSRLKELQVAVDHGGSLQDVQLWWEDNQQGLRIDINTPVGPRGGNALYWASRCGHADSCRYLVEVCGADPDIRREGSGWTPLMSAAMNDKPSCVRVLLALGADPNLRSQEGKTALEEARQNRNHDCIELLSSTGSHIQTSAPASVSVVEHEGGEYVIRSVGFPEQLLSFQDNMYDCVALSRGPDEGWKLISCTHEARAFYIVRASTCGFLDCNTIEHVSLFFPKNRTVEQHIPANVGPFARNIRWFLLPCPYDSEAVYIVNAAHRAFLETDGNATKLFNDGGASESTVISENTSQFAGNIRWKLERVAGSHAPRLEKRNVGVAVPALEGQIAPHPTPTKASQSIARIVPYVSKKGSEQGSNALVLVIYADCSLRRFKLSESPTTLRETVRNFASSDFRSKNTGLWNGILETVFDRISETTTIRVFYDGDSPRLVIHGRGGRESPSCAVFALSVADEDQYPVQLLWSHSEKGNWNPHWSLSDVPYIDGQAWMLQITQDNALWRAGRASSIVQARRIATSGEIRLISSLVGAKNGAEREFIWTEGWSHARAFQIGDRVLFLMYKSGNGSLELIESTRDLKTSRSQANNPLAQTKVRSGWDCVFAYVFGNSAYAFMFECLTGRSQVRSLSNGTSIGPVLPESEKTWDGAFWDNVEFLTEPERFVAVVLTSSKNQRSRVLVATKERPACFTEQLENLREFEGAAASRSTLPVWSNYDYSAIRIGTTLGSGNFGSVSRAAVDGIAGRIAAKMVTRFNTSDLSRALLETELEVLRSLPRSEHVVALVGSSIRPDGTTVILMELLDKSLADHIVKRNEDVKSGVLDTWYELEDLWPVVEGIVRGLRHLHDHKVVHRDLKPGNVLLELGPGNFPLRAVLADFGTSAARVESLMGTVVGTPSYMAPEILQDGQYDGFRADMFSCGITLFEWLVGMPRAAAQKYQEGAAPKVPDLARASLLAAAGKDNSCTHTAVSRLLGNSDEDTTALLRRCCDQRPDRRPSIADLFNLW